MTSDSRIYWWDSKSYITTEGEEWIYDVVKYNDSIRKQACLRRRSRDGRLDEAVAWFPSEDEAVLFAEYILGGVREYGPA